MITALSITNFRGIKALDLSHLESAFFTGLNGSGKTSVLYALRMALYGRCELTTKDGKGASVLVGPDGDEAKVDLVIDGWKVNCRIGADGSKRWQAERDGQILRKPEALWKCLDVTEVYAAVAGDPAMYLKTQEIEDVISGILKNGEVEVKELTDAAGQWGAPLLNELPRGAKSVSIGALKALGDSMYENRRDAKARLAQIKEDAATPLPPYPKNGNGVEITDFIAVRDTLAKVNDQWIELERELGAAKASSKEVDTFNKEALRARKKELETAIFDQDKVIEGLITERDEKRSAVSGIMEERSALRPAEQDADIAVKSSRVDMEKYDDAIKFGECPVCHRAWNKTLDSKLRGPLLIKVNEARDKATAVREQVQALEDAASAAQQEADSASAALKEAQQERGRLDAEHTQVARDLELATRRDKARDLKTIEAERQSYLERIQAGQSILKTLEKINRLTPIHEQHARLIKDIAFYDWCVKAFRDGVLLNTLIVDSLGMFKTRGCEALAPHGYAMDVLAKDKKLIVAIGREGEPLRPWEQISKGEQALTLLAIAKAFSVKQTPLLIDDLDGLDGTNKAVLFEAVSHMTDRQVLMAGAWGLPGQPNANAMAQALGLQVIHLKDGQRVAPGGEVAA